MEGLRSLMRDASVLQGQQYFGEPSIALGADTGGYRLGQVLKRYMAIVILNSEDLRVVVKIHFDPEQIHAYRGWPVPAQGETTDQRVVDFMKEFSNQVGGRVCRAFDSHDVAMGMSVPLCARGIYELYADYATKAGTLIKFGDFWRLEGPFGSLYCSCYFEASREADFSGVRCDEAGSDEGELDFL
jgi:hypothetical protein